MISSTSNSDHCSDNGIRSISWCQQRKSSYKRAQEESEGTSGPWSSSRIVTSGSAWVGSLDTSSDDLDEETGFEQEPKRSRSTSTSPRCGSAIPREPFEHDRLMGIGSVGPSPEEGDEMGLTDGKDLEPQKSLQDCIPRSGLNSGVGESSRGCGSASLLEVLKTRRIAQVEIPAACASEMISGSN